MDTPPPPQLPTYDPWVLSEVDSQKFVDTILNPPEPTPAMVAAVARYKARIVGS